MSVLNVRIPVRNKGKENSVTEKSSGQLCPFRSSKGSSSAPTVRISFDFTTFQLVGRHPLSVQVSSVGHIDFSLSSNQCISQTYCQV